MRNVSVANVVLLSALSCVFAQQMACQSRSAGDAPLLTFQSDVRSILEDSQGNYWFGSWSEGVCRFDGEQFTYFTQKDGLTDGQVRRMFEDGRGVVWFETAFGISSYDGEKLVTHSSRNLSSKDAWQLEDGDLWFKEDGGHGATAQEGCPGVYRYDGETFTYLAFPFDEDPVHNTRFAGTDMARGRGGRQWFATYAAVFGYDGTSFSILDDAFFGLDENSGFLHIRCVFEDSKGRLWVGNNGIGVLLVEDGTATRFTQEHGVGRRDRRSGGHLVRRPGDADEGAPSLHRVFSIGEDGAGHIWFGTVEQGAWRVDGESLVQFTEQDGLTTQGVMAVYGDRRGDLWLGGKGVYRFNGESFDRMH